MDVGSPTQVGTALWWLRILSKKIEDRRKPLQEFDDYYSGEHPLLFATQRFSDAFRGVFDGWCDNWCGLVVDAVEERMTVQGIRFGDEERTDDDAWRMWQVNELDADSKLNHVETLVTGFGYVTVWANPQDEENPLISVEDPLQCAVAYEGGSRRRRLAALKKWLDESGYEYATLYTPDEVFKFRSSSKRPTVTSVSTHKWVQRDVVGEEWPLSNPTGVVTMVEFRNNPRVRSTTRDARLGIDRTAHSEIERVIPIQDGINKITVDMLLAGEFSAFRQRWATGLEIPKDPQTGEPIEPFKAAIDRLWTSGNDNAKFGEFTETNLGNYVKAIEMFVQHVAAQTRTPPHYLLGQSGAFPSGESLKSTESGLVSKTLGHMTHFGERWEEVFRLGFLVKGDKERATIPEAEVRWKNPEFRTEGELVDALTKMSTLGVPQEVLWERWGATDQEIARWKQLRQRDILEAAIAGFGTGTPGAPDVPPDPNAPPVAPPPPAGG